MDGVAEEKGKNKNKNLSFILNIYLHQTIMINTLDEGCKKKPEGGTKGGGSRD